MPPTRLSSTAFWDVDMSQIDFEAQSLYVMEKVFNYGLWEDYKAVIRFYGAERVRREIVAARALDKKSRSLICILLDLKPEDFRCYTLTPSRQSYGSF